MLSRTRFLIPFLAAVLLAAAPAPAGAAPVDDFNKVRRDFQRDGRLTPCEFTTRQLQNAKRLAESSPDLSYSGLASAIDRELARIAASGCLGKGSTLTGAKIGRVNGRAEALTVRNTAGRTLRFRRAAIKNRKGRRATLPNFTLKRGKRVRIELGCRRGRRGVARGRVYACARRGFLADSGDIVRLVDARGRVASQRGFGRYRRAVRF